VYGLPLQSAAANRETTVKAAGKSPAVPNLKRSNRACVKTRSLGNHATPGGFFPPDEALFSYMCGTRA
jgi:hypothetical protein